jgi:hypothetical protein
MDSQWIIGIASGVVVAIIWAVLQTLGRWLFRRRHFSVLAGHFAIRPKLPGQADRGSAEWVAITVTGATLKLRFYDLKTSGGVTGQIQMSESFPNSGVGYYEHLKKGVQRWGHLSIQVASNDQLLVHHSYTNSDRVLITQGFVWQREDPPIIDSRDANSSGGRRTSEPQRAAV